MNYYQSVLMNQGYDDQVFDYHVQGESRWRDGSWRHWTTSDGLAMSRIFDRMAGGDALRDML